MRGPIHQKETNSGNQSDKYDVDDIFHDCLIGGDKIKD
ncbi:hypothetical protein DBT_0993 [Dissulfuribacter thermophilus]|uniref:Uncharacterized protein n=1 Tax=Dissulfuribacter thermophilus TaxID=1156395 RepID=A0A1B9F6U7_9BACT|nr:hypothetical protein DBT_0993 [Dissulfuribacter thermophilus]